MSLVVQSSTKPKFFSKINVYDNNRGVMCLCPSKFKPIYLPSPFNQWIYSMYINYLKQVWGGFYIQWLFITPDSKGWPLWSIKRVQKYKTKQNKTLQIQAKHTLNSSTLVLLCSISTLTLSSRLHCTSLVPSTTIEF